MTKGLQTRERILDTAFRLAAQHGLEGMSLSQLAAELKLSKSGLFAHFGSKEELQLEMLRTASERFTNKVMLPAFKKPRGLPRIQVLFEGWRRWATDRSLPGGCIFVAATAELDDREGRVRDYLVSQQRALLDSLARSARIAIEAGHFRRDLDTAQFAFDSLAIYLAFHELHRLLREPNAERQARRAIARLLADAATRN